MKKVNKKVIVFFLFFLVAFMPLAQADEYVLNDLINKLNINKTELKTNVFSRELNSYPENEINFKNISINELDFKISNQIGGLIGKENRTEKDIFLREGLSYGSVNLNNKTSYLSVKNDKVTVTTPNNDYNLGDRVPFTIGIEHNDGAETVLLYVRVIHESGIVVNYNPLQLNIPGPGSYELDLEIDVNSLVNVLGLGGSFYFSNYIESSDGKTATGQSGTFLINYPNSLIKGTLKDQNGNWLSGVAVKLYSCNGALEESTVTNSQGYWEILTESGDYELKFIYNGVTYIYGGCQFYHSGFTNLDLILTTEVIIDGYFKRLNSNPIIGERFSLLNCNNNELNYDYTDSNGYYAFTASPGNYKLGLRYFGYNFILTECFFAGNNVRFNDLILTTTVSGYLKNEENNGVNNIKAKLVDKNNNAVGSDLTDSNGFYSIYTDAGIYKLIIEYKGFNLQSEYYTFIGNADFGNIYMTFDLNGYLKDLDNNPLVNYKIEVASCNEDPVDHDLTDSSGYFSVLDDSDRYKIFIYAPAGKFKLVSEDTDCFFLFGNINIGTININPYPDCSRYNYICYKGNIKLFSCYFDKSRSSCVCSGNVCEYGCTEGKLTCDSPNTGIINIDADYLDQSPLQGAKINIDGIFKGSTDGNGKFSTNAIYGYRKVDVYCPDNNFCSGQNIYVNGNKDVYFDCDCNKQLGNLRINVLSEYSQPITNVYIFLDNEERGITNFLGLVDIENIPFGTNTLEIALKVGENQPVSKRYNINVDELNEERTIYVTSDSFNGLTVKNEDVYYSSIDEFQPTIVPIVAGALVVGGFVWDYGDFAQCMTGSKTWLGGFFDYTGFLVACKIPVIKLFTEEFCNKKIAEYNQNSVNSCTSEGVWLATNFIPGAVFAKVGKITVKVGKGVFKVIPHIDDAVEGAYRIFRKGSIVTVIKGDEKFIYKISGETIRLTDNIAGKIVDIARKIKNDISKAIENFINGLRKSDLPADVAKSDIGKIQGYLGELGGDKYIEHISERMIKDGADVVIAKGIPEQIFKETDKYILKFDETRTGLNIIEKGKGEIGQIDNLIEVNGRPVITEVKTRPTANIAKDEKMALDHLLKTKLEPLEQIYGKKPEFLLLHPSGEILESTTKSTLNDLTAKGFISKADDLGKDLKFFEDKARVLGGI